VSDALVAHFDARPGAYDRQLLLERRALRVAAAFAGSVEGLDVVDLATGTGALAAALRGRPASLTGVDAAPRMLDVARRRLGPGATLLEADARAVPLPDGAADLVAIGYLLHLLDGPARAAVLAEARRLLRPGGVLVAVVHGSPDGRAGRAYRAAWRALRRVAPGAIVGGGPVTDLRPDLVAAGFTVEASRRVAGAYWSQVVRARRPGEGRAQR
jgi:ubiquinone/menaquinone biosynthesis C-methylase UbiE